MDYYVNFLKSLALKLTPDTVNFFYNDKLKTFPLYEKAAIFYNHKEQLVRTSVRTITLTIYSIANAEMQELFDLVPHATYNANLACHLRDTWITVDKKIEQIVDEAKGVDDIMKQAEDMNEILLYFQDIYCLCEETNPKICKLLTNALLNYAYLPVLVQSLCVLTIKPSLQISTCLYILTQTFNLIKDPALVNPLFAALFFNQVPKVLQQKVESDDRQTPTTYSEIFKPIHFTKLTVAQLTEQYFSTSIVNFESFLL